MERALSNEADRPEIQPFRIDISQADLDDLNNRLAHPLARRAARWRRMEQRRAAGIPEGQFADLPLIVLL